VTERWKRYVDGSVEDAGGRLAAAFAGWRYLTPVLDSIRRSFPPGSRILEIGCGAALHASLLASWGYEMTAGDNDEGVLQTARETVSAFGVDVRLLLLDATALPPDLGGFDLVFSLGLMEHFERDVTVALLRRQAETARWVMAVVPTRHTRYAATITDERIYARRTWETMFAEAGLSVRESFVFGDLPTLPAAVLRRTAPMPAYRWLQRTFDYGMNVCVFGDGRERPTDARSPVRMRPTS
jgi:SAM-dependent methyltransferase